MIDTIDLYELVKNMYAKDVVIEEILIDDKQIVTIEWSVE